MQSKDWCSDCMANFDVKTSLFPSPAMKELGIANKFFFIM